MNLMVVPLNALPAQSITPLLGNQPCKINIYQRLTGLFVDLYVNDAQVVTGVLALNMVKVVREAYRGFTGDIYFYDTQGVSDPTYDGLGERYVLLYAA